MGEKDGCAGARGDWREKEGVVKGKGGNGR